MEEKIGGVLLNYDYYKGQDLYNEGDDVESLILETVQKSTDYKEHLKILLQDDRWPVLYQLSKQRENIIAPMKIEKDNLVLEIGAGMGAVTGAIATRCQRVDCIELSKRRSLANAYRHRDFDNIKIYVGNFEDISLDRKYDVITLIGVLEYAQHYMTCKNPYDTLIQRAIAYLNDGGILYVAIENKLGMKYFSGASEDHLGRPFVGIEGYNPDDKVKTFSHSQLETLLLENGFKSTYFYYPFPDYKLPTEIYSDDYLPTGKINFSTFANYDMERLCIFNEKLAFESLAGAEEVKMLANSFLVEATKE